MREKNTVTVSPVVGRWLRERLCGNVLPNDYWFAGVLYKTTDLYFICEIEDFSCIKAMDDVAGFLWVAPEDIKPRQLAFTSGRIALQRLLEYLKLPVSG